jgi:sarcosine oxidase subunit alpha
MPSSASSPGSSSVTLTVNGASVSVALGATVAVAVAIVGQACRTSVSGEPRGPLCGMGICFECRVSINGAPHCRSCQILCEPGMDVRTDG